jgi:hypothetical protein
MARFAFASLWLALSSAGCQFDIDKIYEHEPPDGPPSNGEDAGSDGGDDTALPASLVDLWRDAEFVTDACQKCAKQKCGEVNTSCRADQDCAELTRCVAVSTDPDTHSACRARKVPWLLEAPDKRALGGPYYSCVFRDSCDEECKTHTDWSCLGNYGWDRATTDSVNVAFQFVDFNTPTNVAAMADIKLCGLQEDFNCELPVQTGLTTDERGIIALDLPIPSSGFFDGYLELTGQGWYPTLARFGWPLARAGVIYLPVVKQALFDIFVNSADVTPDPERGLLQMRMFGCAGVGMRNVLFEADHTDEMSQTWYAVGRSASFDAVATDDLGSGGIINVKPGSVRINAFRRLTDGTKGELVARANAPVRKGFLSIVILTPLAE